MITPIVPISGGPGGTGPAGPQGPAGQNAVQPTFSVGTVASGATPAVTITGSQTSPVLNFTLKPGDAGSTGPSGPSGTNGANGTNAVQPTFTIGTVAAGVTPAVSLTGTQTAPVLNFTLKSGDAGSTGAAGPAGTNAVQPTFSIGSVTSNATPAVTLTGTQTAPVLNFALKPGTDGAIGPAGPSGAVGATGVGLSPGAPATATVAFATAYQAPTPAKSALVSVMVETVYTVTLAGTQTDEVELRVGPDATVATGGGSQACSTKQSITGIAVSIGQGFTDRTPLMALIPPNWYFAVRRISGTVTVVNSARVTAMT